MEIPGIRMCDGDMYASYEGWYGVGDDVYATGGATQWGGGGGDKLLVCGGGDLGVVEALSLFIFVFNNKNREK